MVVLLSASNNPLLHGLSYYTQRCAGKIENFICRHYMARPCMESMHTISCAHIAAKFSNIWEVDPHVFISDDVDLHHSLDKGSLGRPGDVNGCAASC